MSRRRAGHVVETYARTDPARTAGSLVELVGMLDHPRVVWLMIPAGEPTRQQITTLTLLLAPGDIVIDGGNSNYRDSMRHAALLKDRGIRFLDVGVSGGIWGFKEGFCMMAGGDQDTFAVVEPALKTLAPPDGYRRVGPNGAGHFVKMVHNGIEYGIMEAYAEGFELLRAKEEFDLNLPEVPTGDAVGRTTRRIVGLRDARHRLLVVDDKADNRRLLRDLLVPVGFAVEEAADGASCVERVLADAPAAVLLYDGG